MRTGLLSGFAAWLFTAASVLAQAPTPTPGTEATCTPTAAEGCSTKPPNAEVPASTGTPLCAPASYRLWFRGEYLAYWVRNAPLPVSLVTGDPANPTQELLNSDRSLGMFSGFRVGFGAWLDPCNHLGIEGNFFELLQRTRNFTASSDAAGNPTLAFPFTNQTPGAVGDTLMPISSPGVFAGNVLVASSLSLLGTELNGIVSSGGDINLSLLAGFRYLELHETLSIDTQSSDILTVPNTMLSQTDQFSTRNQFYGGQIGGRVSWEGSRFGLDVTGKFAMGITHQFVTIQGDSTQTGPGGPNGTFPGGFFTQTSNIGHTTANQFGMIPSVEVKFSVFITPQLRTFVGYDFMYWSRVVRPGNQVDRNINLTQSEVFGNGALLGPAFPAPLFNRSDFWAQGLNVGLEFRF